MTFPSVVLRFAPWGLVVAALVGLRVLDVRHQREIGAARVRAQAQLLVRQWQDSATAFRQQLALRQETVTVATTRWRTTAAQVDTQWLRSVPDTVRVPVEVVRTIVAQADTAVNACTRALTDCTRLAASLDSVIVAQRTAQQFAPTPPRAWRRWGGWVAAGVAGYLIGATRR
jgi:hypothetical protein